MIVTGFLIEFDNVKTFGVKIITYSQLGEVEIYGSLIGTHTISSKHGVLVRLKCYINVIFHRIMNPYITKKMSHCLQYYLRAA